MHHRTLPLLLSLILPAILRAEELPTAEAPPALAEKITALVDVAIKEKQLAGAVVAVARNGTVLHFSAHGQMNREEKIPMREDAIFRIYSMTKAITTAAAMILVEEGAFALDDPIGDHIPELADLKVYATPESITPARQPSVRDLMRHTAGFGLGFSVRTQTNDKWDPAAPVGEYGWGGAASTHYWVSPDDKKLIVVTMEQTKPYTFLLESALKGPIYEVLRQP